MSVYDTIPEHAPAHKTVVIDVNGQETSLKVDISQGDNATVTRRLNWDEMSADTRQHLIALDPLVKADIIAKEQSTP